MTMASGRRLVVGFVSVLLVLGVTVKGQAVPQLINYQGSLTNADGSPVNATVAMTFGIYDADLEGNLIWGETQASVTVTGGVFNVLLGAVNPLSADSFSGDRWLSVTVGVETLSPRARIASTAYALRAGTAESVAGGAVTSASLVDGAVSGAKIASGAVTTAKLEAGSVTSAKLADGSVIGKIVNEDGAGSGLDADTLDGLDSSVFGRITQLSPGTGLAGGGQSGNVALGLGANYADGSAYDGRFVNVAGDTMTGTLTLNSPISCTGCVSGTNIATDTITAADIAAGAIGASELAAGAVGSTHLSSTLKSGFVATMLADQIVDSNTQVALAFNSESYDPNGHYNPATATFTAPEAGFYHFDCKCMLQNLVSSGNLRLYLATDWVQKYAPIPAYEHITITTDKYLNVGETVKCEIYHNANGGASVTVPRTSGRFSGFRIH